MYDLGIISNGHILVRELSKWSQMMPSQIDKAVRTVAQEFIKDCMVEIDKLIYSQPAPEGYKRTKTLRKGHKMERVGEGTYLVNNLVSYAFPQHDGWTDRGGVKHKGRPWMDIAMAKNEKKYEEIMDVSIKDLF